MAGVRDLALVKFAENILKSAKDKFEKFMEHKEPQTYEEYKKSWEEKDNKKNSTQTSTQIAKEDKKNESEKKQEQKESVVKKEPKAKTTKKSTSTKTKVKTPKASVSTKTKTEPTKNKTDKKVTTKKSTPVKKTTTDKKVTAKKEQAGSKKEAKIKLYTKDVKKHYGSVDANFLDIIVKNLGPSIYRKDAESVSCTDPKELNTVRKNFCIKKLGFDKSETKMLDEEIKKVCNTMKASKIKYRATFYYILAKNLKKESVLN